MSQSDSTSNQFTSRSREMNRSSFVSLLFSLATFNIRGLGQDDGSIHSKREQLGTDMCRYHVDICALQETKVTEPLDCRLNTGHRLICFEQKCGRHGGLGFVLSPRFAQYVTSWNYISDRVCVLGFRIPSRSGNPICCRVVNAYSPHRKLAADNPALLDNFYSQLSDAIKVSSNTEIFPLGDFNSKLGRLTSSDYSYGLNSFMGSHGMGTRNDMGDHLLDFLSEHDLLAANTCFQHSSRHKTTYTGWRKDWSAGQRSKKTLPVYSQIDYVLCRNRSRSLLVNARSYAGAYTYSDHRLVVAKFNFGKIPFCFRRPNKSALKFKISELTSNLHIQEKYHDKLNQLASNVNVSSNSCPNNDLEQLLGAIKDAAKCSVGIQDKKIRLRHHSDDDDIQQMSSERYQLRQQLNNNQSIDRSKLRTSINKLTNTIQKRLK